MLMILPVVVPCFTHADNTEVEEKEQCSPFLAGIELTSVVLFSLIWNSTNRAEARPNTVRAGEITQWADVTFRATTWAEA